MKVKSKVFYPELPASEKVVPRCPHFGPCGGCSVQNFSYPAQVEWKRKILEEVLQREGKFHAIPPIDVVPMEDPWGYRNKMELSFGQEGDRVVLGLHQRSSFQRIVDLSVCHIAPPEISDLIQALKEAINPSPLRAYHPKTHQGFWRYAVIRFSSFSKALMVLLVTNDGPREAIEALAASLPKRIPALKSIYWGISTRVSDVAVPERMSLFWGEEALYDQVGSIRFQIRPTNFVQPNLRLAHQIYEAIRRQAALTGTEVVYDLYCGIGLIAISLAEHAQAVYGVESDSDNVACAQRNASLNRLENALFLCGKVEDLLRGRALFKAGPPPDVIVIDPPRAGLHKEVYAPLLDADATTILYLSCNPASLSRDLKIFMERDSRYQLESLQLFDFFPHTAHMETLAALRRR